MAKDTRVTFDSGAAHAPNKPSNKVRHNRVTERQISFEDAENYVNEMTETFPRFNRAHSFMRQVSGSFNNRTIKVALILSVILNLLLGIPFGIFFGFWMSQKQDTAVDSSSSSSLLNSLKSHSVIETCFPCSERDVDLNSRVKVKSKNNICCTDDKIYEFENSPYFCMNGDVFKRRCFAEPDEARAPLPCKDGAGGSQTGNTQSVAAAHLMLDVPLTKSALKDGTATHNPMVWMKTDSQHRTFIQGVAYEDGQLKITRPGKYHIYSHVTLSTNENPLPESESEKIIVHSLQLIARGTPKELLFSQVTMKVNEVKSSDIEGSFHLLEGDYVAVYVSHPSFLKNVAPANVFGLFIL